MLDAGWRHWRYHGDDLQTNVQLTTTDRRSGKFALRIRAAAADPKNGPTQIETSPVWIDSPPTPVRAGQLVRIDVMTGGVTEVGPTPDALGMAWVTP